MNQPRDTTPRSPLLPMVTLAALGCLALASCDASYCERDKAFSQATQKHLAGEIQKQAALLATAEKQLAPTGKQAAMPTDFKPWWASIVEDKMFGDSQPAKEGLDDLLARALKTSSQIKVFSDIPLIRQTGIREARGEFDTHLFAEAAYQYTNDPVGNVLTTGNAANRFHQYEQRLEGGVRKKLLTGADVALSQRLVRTNNNSVFFEPDPQATAVLALTIVQPLLKGGGVEYNTSFIRIAKLDTEIGRKEFIRQTESHLLEINRSYWNLYLARAITAQKAKLVKDTAAVVDKLQKRSDIDAMRSELDRAKAALAKRRADLVRAEMSIKNTEDRIKALINDPTLLASPAAELLPANPPSTKPLEITIKDAAATALENRPEIAQSILQLKTAAIRLEMAKNELMPQLDLILETSIGGLDKAGPITSAWDDQWVHPGYLVGLRLDYPMENNAAQARLLRRKLEIRQQLAQIQTTVDTVLLEVKIAARELNTSYHEMLSRYESLLASHEDLKTVEKRWEPAAGGDKSAVGYLQFMIDTQDRLAQAEEDFALACTIYNVAMVNLQRAQGTLLRYENVQITRDKEDAQGLPVLRLEKIGAAAAPAPAPTPAPTPEPAAAPKPEPAPAPAPKAAPAPAPAAASDPTTRPVAARYSLWPPK